MKNFLQSIANLFNLVVITKEEYTKLKTPVTTITDEPNLPTNLLTYDKIIAMLKEYDDKKLIFSEENNKVTTKALSYEDARITTFDFYELKNYLAYTEKLAKDKDITIAGLGFIKGLYNKENAHEEKYVGYENLMYLPTTIMNNQEILVDLNLSSKENIVTFNEALAENGYKWRYDNSNTFKKAVSTQNIVNSFQKSSSSSSSAGNRTGTTPPHKA